MSNYTSSTTSQESPTPSSNGNVLVFRNKIDDPFFSGTSFPSPGIASPERESTAPCYARTRRSAPVEIPEFYTTADQIKEKTCRPTAECSTSPGTTSSPANKKQPTPSPTRSSPGTQSSDQERTQDTPNPKREEAAKPYLSIAIPAWTDCGPMQQPPPSTTPRTVHVRPSTSRYPHLPLSPPLPAGPPSHSTREEDLLRELQIAHREIRHLRAELVKYQNSLVDAEKEINSLTELLQRDREAFTRLRDRIRVLEYAATFLTPDSVRRGGLSIDF